MNIEIKKADSASIPLIQSLSENIWRTHYSSIISMEQIDYMLSKMYSDHKLLEEIQSEFFSYYLVFNDTNPIGYLAISSEDAENYFLHKFYILQVQQGKGLGEIVFKRVFDTIPYQHIQLFVNRQNFKSVNFYFKLGFKIVEVVDNHFGENYFMNDFRMLKTKTQNER